MTKILKILILSTISIAAVIFLFTAAMAQGDVRVVYLRGEPTIMKTGTSVWGVCRLDMPVSNGDRIKTLEGESVVVSFAKKNSNIVNIDENSDVFIKKCDAPYSIELLNGSAMALVKELPKDSTFEIRTPIGLSGARATGWSAGYDGARSAFKAFEEKIYAAALDASGNIAGSAMDVKEGWGAVIGKDKAVVVERLTAKDIEKWNEWRKDLMTNLGIPFASNLDNAGVKGSGIDSLGSDKDIVNEALDEKRIPHRLKVPAVSRKGDY